MAELVRITDYCTQAEGSAGTALPADNVKGTVKSAQIEKISDFLQHLCRLTPTKDIGEKVGAKHKSVMLSVLLLDGRTHF